MKVRLLITMTLVLALLLGSCGAASGATARVAAGGADLMVGIRAAEKPPNPSEPDRAFVDSVGGFTWAMFREAAKESGNVVISPASVYLALAMTLNGAGGTTRAAILKALVADKLSVDTVNAAGRDWTALMMATSSRTKLKIGNSIWYNKGFDVDSVFLQVNADFHAAALRQLDFGDSGSAKVINDWVSQATDGKIVAIMDRTEPGDSMYLINAVYFESQWQNQFISTLTSSGSFFLGTNTISVKYMNREDDMTVLSDAGIKGVLLPFSDKRFAFVAVLPPDGRTVREAFGYMDMAAFQQLLKSGSTARRSLYLPKFKIEYETSLVDLLTRLGMGVAFSSGADFSLMARDRSKGLMITGVRHKVFFKADENGVQAAATTGVSMAGIVREGDNKLVFNRPFLYGIIDTITGLPLFLGIMDNPAA